MYNNCVITKVLSPPYEIFIGIWRLKVQMLNIKLNTVSDFVFLFNSEKEAKDIKIGDTFQDIKGKIINYD